MNKNKQQINISMPQEWHERLERCARIESMKRDKTVSHIDLIREALKNKFDLPDDEIDDRAISTMFAPEKKA